MENSGKHQFETLRMDNVRDHRAGTSDLPFLEHAQDRLRVHRIVIPRLLNFGEFAATITQVRVFTVA